MPCYYPRTAYPIEGGVTFEKPRGHSGHNVKIDCRKCLGCRLDYGSGWSVRMMDEASEYRHNQFVTLTYEDTPALGNLCQEDMQKFYKRLRKHFSPEPLRYAYSAEYGSKTSRPHYHAIIFNLPLDDLIAKDKNERGDLLYGSELLKGIWELGDVTIGDVTHQSCRYAVSYMLKDMQGNYKQTDEDGNPLAYYTVDVETGESIERVRPFARYSNKPGIGRSWIEKYYTDVFPKDQANRLVNGKLKQFPVPEYYFRVLEQIDPELHSEVKEKRESAIWTPQNRWNSTPERLRVRETCKKAKLGEQKSGTKRHAQKTVYIKGDS